MREDHRCQSDRPQLRKLLAALQRGSVVIIPAVDRISRDTTDLLPVARQIKEAVAEVRALVEPALHTTSHIVGAMLAAPSIAAKLERSRIIERTTCGCEAFKAEGVKFDRKPKRTLHQKRESTDRVTAGKRQRAFARSPNRSWAAISRLEAAAKSQSANKASARALREKGFLSEHSS